MKLRGCVTMDVYGRSEYGEGAALLKIASSTRYGRVAFAVLCDGPEEEESQGEAATIAAEYLEKWFLKEFPQILKEAELSLINCSENGMKARVITEVLRYEDRALSYSTRVFHAAKEQVKEGLKQLVTEINIRIAGRGRLTGRNMKAVVATLLVMGGEYLLMRVGSPVAFLSDCDQLRKLSGVHQQEGAETVCLGKTQIVEPVFIQGEMETGSGLLLCSSRFVRLQDYKYLQKRLRHVGNCSERKMDRILRAMTKSIRKKGEKKDVYAICLACTE